MAGKFADPGLFLETTAHFARLAGYQELRDAVAQGLAAAPRIATSDYVRLEFRVVVRRTATALDDALAAVAGPHGLRRSREITELTKAVRASLGPRPPGGSLVHDFLEGVVEGFAGRRPSIRRVRMTIAGMAEELLLALDVVNGRPWAEYEIIPGAACCRWPEAGLTLCDKSIPGICGLQGILDLGWDDFIAAVSIVRRFRSLPESRKLRRILPDDYTLQKEEALDLTVENPDAFGDILIYLEVPDSWTLLTRDRAHHFLIRDGPRVVRLGWIRPLRTRVDIVCTITGAGGRADGRAFNMTNNDVGIRVENCRIPIGRRIIVTMPGHGGERPGRLMSRRPSVAGDGYLDIGIRFSPLSSGLRS